MEEKVMKKTKSVSRHFWIFFLILIIGIFLRTYHFSDWLRFNSDQSRDSKIVRLMLEGKELPLLGPVAGGTNFKLGPITYYFQYASASLFGLSPDKMAYADLFWGILSIPLLYVLLLNYFKKKTSLFLSGLYAVCCFAIQYSRFAWNPNSAPFFGMLFMLAALKLCETSGKKKVFWAIFCGLALGILVQLHTILLAGAPLAFFLVSILWFKNKSFRLKYWLIVVLATLLINIPQIVNEIKTKGANYYAFIDAVSIKNQNQSSLPENIMTAVNCHFGSNLKIILPLGDIREKASCQFIDSGEYKRMKKSENIIELAGKLLLLVISYLFSIGGYVFLFFSYKSCADAGKKNFILVVSIFILSLMIFIFLVAQEITLRYFILLSFVPYIFLGLWMKHIINFKKIGKPLITIIAIILLAFNVLAIKKSFTYWSQDGDVVDGSLDQVRNVADYIVRSSHSGKIQIYSSKNEFGRFKNRISYFTDKAGIEIFELDKKSEVDWSIPVVAVINKSSKDYEMGDFYKFGYIVDFNKSNGIWIMRLSEK